MVNPAIIGPSISPEFVTNVSIAFARGTSVGGTRSARNAHIAGPERATAPPLSNANTSWCHGSIVSMPIITAWIAITTAWNSRTAPITLRRSNRSAVAPAKSGSSSMGIALTPATAPTQKLEPVRSYATHDIAAVCESVPMSNTASDPSSCATPRRRRTVTAPVHASRAVGQAGFGRTASCGVSVINSRCSDRT